MLFILSMWTLVHRSDLDLSTHLSAVGLQILIQVLLSHLLSPEGRSDPLKGSELTWPSCSLIRETSSPFRWNRVSEAREFTVLDVCWVQSQAGENAAVISHALKERLLRETWTWVGLCD